ncbi:MAG: hypothetical protein IJJ52_00920, partial [Lachnospiraceae bacterium]|nr:hypothetical protein [Lachnospiraceae bacterium]
DVHAEVYISGGEYKIRDTVFTSAMKAFGCTGKDISLGGDTTIMIDESITLGRIYLHHCALTTYGVGVTNTMTTSGFETSTGGTARDFINKSGNIKINYSSNVFASPDGSALYHTGNFIMEGGSLLINAGCAFGIDSGSFQMKGGSLTIKCTSSKNTFYAIDPFSKGSSSFISGGNVWVEITSSKGGVGIHIPENGTFSVKGGRIKINAALESGYGHAISGYTSSALDISGGTLELSGRLTGISFASTSISGNASVKVKGLSSTEAAVYVSDLEMSGHPTLEAEGAACAISIDGGDNFLKYDPTTLWIAEPSGGIIAKYSGTRTGIVKSSTDSTPAKKVIITYVDSINKVTVQADPDTVTKGKISKVVCTAVVDGYVHDTAMKWVVSGNQSSGTKIGSDGVLTIAADETADTLEILGALVKNESFFGETKIRLLDQPGVPPGVTGSDAAALKDASSPAPISAAAVGKIPVDKSIGKIDASKIRTKGQFSKKWMHLYYTKVKGASNYLIAYRKAGSSKWTFYTAGNAAEFVIKKMKARGLTQFKLAAYKDGRRGPWSNLSCRYYVKAGGKAAAGQKSIKFSLKKVKGATGYQAEYSLYKSMKKSKLKTVKGKTAFTVSKLKSGKTYYVRWRPYRAYKGKKYLGIYSAVKKVKVK